MTSLISEWPLGRMSEMGYGTMFGSDVQKDFFLKRIKGRGYVDVGNKCHIRVL